MFDAKTGLPVAGATITLLDQNGQPIADNVHTNLMSRLENWLQFQLSRSPIVRVNLFIPLLKQEPTVLLWIQPQFLEIHVIACQ